MASAPELALLEEIGAVRRGHFLLSSGRHSDVYIEKFRLLERPDVLKRLAERLAHQAPACDLVAGPTTGGVLVAFAVADALRVPARYVETENGAKVLRRGATIDERARVFVVDDVLTTGLSLRETIGALQAEVVGVGVLIDRSEETLDFGVPLVSAIRIEAQSWESDALPEHLRGTEPVRPGTRASD